MRDLPAGTVTFLFTDIESSTQLLHELGDGYAATLAEHRRLLREAFARNRGAEVDTQGDAFFVAFARASDALAAAEEAQRALAATPVRVRMGIHTGEPVVTEEGYVGLDVHKGARIAAAGHGGQVLLSEQTARLLDDGLGLRDLGPHRLKDLGEAQRLYQLGREEFPPLKSLNWTNLPEQPTPLVGREEELADLLALLRREDIRVVTLTGPGGSGKTRLAIQGAAEAVEEFDDGVVWVSLQALRDPELVLYTIAQAAGARESALTYFRGRRALVLLDNLEQLLGSAPGLSELLAAAPRLKLLATSREPLHIGGELEYPVGPLDERDATALFAERARAVQAGFIANGEVAEICRRLDRLPLAIELAAARVKVLPLATLLERLERRLPLLSAGRRDAPARQRTLRATIEWSYDLLDEAERRLFARLGVFAGGWTLEAGEEVGDADLDTLASLVDKSLVRAEGERFTMLETIREYALEQLEASGAAVEIRQRHAAHFLALAREAEPELLEGRQVYWLDRLDLERDNLRAAMSWALDRGDADVAVALAAATFRLWFVRPGPRDQGLAAGGARAPARPADACTRGSTHLVGPPRPDAGQVRRSRAARPSGGRAGRGAR